MMVYYSSFPPTKKGGKKTNELKQIFRGNLETREEKKKKKKHKGEERIGTEVRGGKNKNLDPILFRTIPPPFVRFFFFFFFFFYYTHARRHIYTPRKAKERKKEK